MVQANMGIKTYTATSYGAEPEPNNVVKKKIQDGNEWVDRTFIRMPINYYPGIEKWCWEHYGKPVHLGQWFVVGSYILMDEKVFFFWKLCE